MTTFRDNPVPEGVYWSDITGTDNLARWTGYLESVNKDEEHVRILKTVHHSASGGGAESVIPGVDTILEALGEGTAQATPERDWVLWQAMMPLVWDYTYLPAINTAENVTSEEDTVTKPPPEQGLISSLSETAETAGTVAKVVTGVVVLAGLGWLASKLLGKR